MKQIPAVQQILFFVFLFSTGLSAQVPTPVHVVIVIEENHDYSSIIGSAAAPYINALATDSNGALFTQSYALTHPSQPNYLMLYSGSNQGVTDDNLPAVLPFTTPNLGSSLIASGKTFAGYSEDLPSVGYTGTSYGAYARKHNPWVNWQGNSTNGIPVSANLPLTNFPTQYDSLPTISFVIPNQNNDMHNGSDPARITTSDTWLQNHLNSYIQWAKTNNSLFILTFDEGTNSGTNRIATLFVGPMVKHGQYNEGINHYSFLRTIEDMYGLSYAGNSSTATSITDCWVSATGVPNGTALIPNAILLEQNYPNPFNPLTNLQFTIYNWQFVSVKVFDFLGREVTTLVKETLHPGLYHTQWDASRMPSGVYYYRLQAGPVSQMKKMILMK
jgi:acid phosphatase